MYDKWEGLANRRADMAGMQEGVNERILFRGVGKALGVFGGDIGLRVAILAGATWPQVRRAEAYGENPNCDVCEVIEEAVHRWFVCPRWEHLRDKTEFDLRAEGRAANWEPRCLCECGILPAPAQADRPPPAPQEGGPPGLATVNLDGGNV